MKVHLSKIGERRLDALRNGLDHLVPDVLLKEMMAASKNSVIISAALGALCKQLGIPDPVEPGPQERVDERL